jgi:predicted Fe-Mo cluster-binding NifX family protein
MRIKAAKERRQMYREGGKKMKIGVPSFKPGGLDAMVSAHFGHCEAFTVVELKGKKIVKAWELKNPTEHDCMAPAQKLKEEGVEKVLIGGIGRRPLIGMQEMGIEVYIGATGNVKDAISDYLEGFLKIATTNDVCQGCHGHE